jgi:hypothetical protein
VPVPGRHEVCLSRPILSGSNPVRCAEIWLQNGGLDDGLARGARGTSYEAGLRSKFRRSIARNALLGDTRCAEHAVKKNKVFREEIDLLIQVGDLLVVGEAKCFLFPADSRERLNYMENLAKAAAQAKRKAAAVAARPDVAAHALGIAPERAASLRVVPLVVVNQGFGVSYEIGDCRITDARFLALYLGSGSYVPHALVAPGDAGYALGSGTLYRSQAEAATLFEETLRDPPTLRRFRDRLAWDLFPFPTASGEPLFVATTTLQDISPEMRREGLLLAAAAGF